jgi:hypothetical protein
MCVGSLLGETIPASEGVGMLGAGVGIVGVGVGDVVAMQVKLSSGSTV